MVRVRSFAAAGLALVLVIIASLPARADVVGVVRGIVVDAQRRPLAAVSVTLRSERTTLSATTTGDGRFAFPRVPFGHYTLRAVGSAAVASGAVDIATDAVVDVTLVAGSVIGRANASATSVRGTPVSENAFGPAKLAALPRSDRLDAVVEQVPGIVRFSYDEPVAHGFHGITYELDGAPLPQSTSSNFAQLIDPRNASAVEIFTGAFPAEFGGSRQGAVVNVVGGGGDDRATGGSATLGGGLLGTSEARLVDRFAVGRARLALALNAGRTSSGLEAPSSTAVHDASSSANGFLRVALPLGERDMLAADVSQSFSTFRIPINTNPGDPRSPLVSVPGTDDVQREYDRFAALSFTQATRDGSGYVRVVPWMRWNRVAYDGDLARDTLGYVVADDGTVVAQNGLRQDRAATYVGLRVSTFHATDRHAIKAGLDVSQESFRSNVLIRFPSGPDFRDDAAQRGSATGAYVEDKWTPVPTVAIDAGLRFDRSTGYVGGSQLNPRLEINDEIARGTVLHAYVGRLYAAPALEDVRRDAVVTNTSPVAAPVYDLQPERDTYVELGFARTFHAGLRAYVNAFARTAVNVLDTTQLANTPLFAVFNNAVGVDRGVEARLESSTRVADLSFSATYQRALAGGVSGGTFLFDPGSATDLTLQPEDHDQTWAGNAVYTRRLGGDLRTFATLQTEYGTGFPVAFENGDGRLPAHWLVNLALGRTPEPRGLGWSLDVDNLFDKRFLLKVNNGFNTTQWNEPRRVLLRLSAGW